MISLDLIVIGLLHASIESKMIADSYQSHTKEINEHKHTLQILLKKKKWKNKKIFTCRLKIGNFIITQMRRIQRWALIKYIFALHLFVVNFSMQCDKRFHLKWRSYSMVHVIQTNMYTNKTTTKNKNEDTRLHRTCIAPRDI